MPRSKDDKVSILESDDLEERRSFYTSENSLGKVNSLRRSGFEESIREFKHSTSDFETLIHLLKGNIGTGCLAIPQAFMNIGLWGGVIGLPVIGIISIHCMHLLLRSSRELCWRSGKDALNYEQTAEMCFHHGPERVRPWSKIFFRVVQTFLIITQIGFCCVYLVFVSLNLYQAMECMFGGTSLGPISYMGIVVVPLIFLCFLRNLKLLAPVSSVAMSLQLLGLIFIIYYLVRDLPVVEMKVPAFVGFEKLPLFFGTAMYTFEGINLILPLENNMRNPDRFPGWNGVLNSGMTLVLCLYVGIGFYGYLEYGDFVLGSITLNLPGDEVLSQSVKLLFALAIFMSYPLQFYVPVSILLPSIVDKFSTERGKYWVDKAFRTGIVLLTFILAAAIPNIALFTNLIGTICSSNLVLIFPPLIETVTFWPDKGWCYSKLIKNVCISCFGIFGFVTGAFSSVSEIVSFYKSDDTAFATGC
ncbi:Proton-coupled amino acid transporter 1 [Armadillidium nasatum]|uniref:Proton-coupled amino acid transporter 1 n=1 Tax=Armadillidium nasatum TaxID=96803 RepID=A0A5N5SUA5_9CRUS|nr:Proton-coupled amino acid transporter 1 [Armadillidium nasatum]